MRRSGSDSDEVGSNPTPLANCKNHYVLHSGFLIYGVKETMRKNTVPIKKFINGYFEYPDKVPSFSKFHLLKHHYPFDKIHHDYRMIRLLQYACENQEDFGEDLLIIGNDDSDIDYFPYSVLFYTSLDTKLLLKLSCVK